MQQAIKKFKAKDWVDFYRIALGAIQATMPGLHLSEGEAIVLAEFLSFKGKVAGKHRFSGPFRKEVMENLMMSSSRMTNLLNELVKKGVLVKNGHGDYDFSSTFPVFPDDLSSIKIIIDGPDVGTA
ncbi:MAG: hypothetical protein H6546_02885 [Chitinophagales bacterium]|nr:hypothetical protein [Candidatus Andersenbacteria bacterium]MCB9019251.1 hypothetical protein [Chitinophagales bacterium]